MPQVQAHLLEEVGVVVKPIAVVTNDQPLQLTNEQGKIMNSLIDHAEKGSFDLVCEA